MSTKDENEKKKAGRFAPPALGIRVRTGVSSSGVRFGCAPGATAAGEIHVEIGIPTATERGIAVRKEDSLLSFALTRAHVVGVLMGSGDLAERWIPATLLSSAGKAVPDMPQEAACVGSDADPLLAALRRLGESVESAKEKRRGMLAELRAALTSKRKSAEERIKEIERILAGEKEGSEEWDLYSLRGSVETLLSAAYAPTWSPPAPEEVRAGGPRVTAPDQPVRAADPPEVTALRRLWDAGTWDGWTCNACGGEYPRDIVTACPRCSPAAKAALASTPGGSS